MATELKADVIAGLDEPQAQALRKAGVETVEKLATIDPEAMARETGLAADELRQLKAAAAAFARPEAPARPVRRSRAAAWVILALTFIAVVSVLYAIRAPAGMRSALALQEQKLVAATARSASIAAEHTQAAAFAVGAGNWGVAQKELDKAGDEITFLETIAPQRLQGQVQDARAARGRAQEAVGSQDAAAADRIKELGDGLARLSGAKEG